MENQKPSLPEPWLLHKTPMRPENATTDEMSSTLTAACWNGSRNGDPQYRLVARIEAT